MNLGNVKVTLFAGYFRMEGQEMNPLNFSNDQHGWAELLPARKPSKKLRGEHRVPWVVIGAGFTGLACARRLAELHSDDEIFLVDARAVGQAASGRNAGYAVNISHFPGAYVAEKKHEYERINRINRAGVELLRTAVSDHSIDCAWCEKGFYYGAADQHALEQRAHFLRYLNIMKVAHSPLDGSQMAERLGTSVYKSGVYVDDGVLVQPAALVYGLVDSLPKNIKLFEHSAVLKIRTRNPVCLEFEHGTVKADKVIVATNSEAGSIGFLKRYVVGSTLAGSFTRVLSADELAKLGSLRQWGVLSLHGGGATVRSTADGRIMLLNTAEYNGGALLSARQLAERRKIHREHFERRFPQLSDVPFEFSWSGVEGVSRNGTNFFGKQLENIYLAGGYNGSGVSKGTAFGAGLADYASGAQSQLITDCLASAPAMWIPPRPILDIGAVYKQRSRFKGVGLDR